MAKCIRIEASTAHILHVSPVTENTHAHVLARAREHTHTHTSEMEARSGQAAENSIIYPSSIILSRYSSVRPANSCNLSCGWSHVRLGWAQMHTQRICIEETPTHLHTNSLSHTHTHT